MGWYAYVAFVEQNKFCQQVLAKHWPGVPIHDDVRTVGAKDFAEPIDVISGGFPCQPYSLAGPMLGSDDDRALWPEYRRIIQELKPSWVVGENVVGIIDVALDDVLADLEGIGYSARAFDIPASAVGARIQRRRIFIVANSNSKRQQGRKEIPLMAKGDEQLQGFLPAGFRPALSELRANRGSDGIPNRMDRLKSLGNAVVPQQIYPIMKAIAEIGI